MFLRTMSSTKLLKTVLSHDVSYAKKIHFAATILDTILPRILHGYLIII